MKISLADGLPPSSGEESKITPQKPKYGFVYRDEREIIPANLAASTDHFGKFASEQRIRMKPFR